MATKANKVAKAPVALNEQEEVIVMDNAPESAEATETAETINKVDAYKQKKKEAAQRFMERRAAEKTERIEKAKAFIESCKAKGYWDTFSNEEKAFITKLTQESSNNGAATSGLFVTLFGKNPQVGDKITLLDAMKKSLQSKAKIDAYCKKWADKGTVITFSADAEDILNSVYTVEALPTA